jgi:hydrogenase maturation factor
VGKLSDAKLNEIFRHIKRNEKVVISPSPGYDSGVHLLDENHFLVVSTDPCIGVPERWFGWLLVHYAASDVALFGATPEFCTITLLGPMQAEADDFKAIMMQVFSAVDDLCMTVVTGHSGTYDGISTFVGSCTAYGKVAKENLITPGGAQAGDSILCTKNLGLETAVSFTFKRGRDAEKLFGLTRTRILQKLVTSQSCVKEASLLAGLDGVHSMHDASEGGFVAALNEMARNSGLGIRIEWEMLPILNEVLTLQKSFNLNQREILSISSTGTLLAAVDPIAKDVALKKLEEQGIEAHCIGAFTKSKESILVKGHRCSTFPKMPEDPYAKIMMK